MVNDNDMDELEKKERKQRAALAALYGMVANGEAKPKVFRIVDTKGNVSNVTIYHVPPR